MTASWVIKRYTSRCVTPLTVSFDCASASRQLASFVKKRMDVLVRHPVYALLPVSPVCSTTNTPYNDIYLALPSAFADASHAIKENSHGKAMYRNTPRSRLLSALRLFMSFYSRIVIHWLKRPASLTSRPYATSPRHKFHVDYKEPAGV